MYKKALANDSLQLVIKNLRDEISSFKSGEKYKKMAEEYKQMLDYEERIIRRLKNEIEELHKTIVRNRNNWFEVSEDLVKEHEKSIKKMQSDMARMYKKMMDSLRQRDEALDKLKVQSSELKETKEKLKEEQEKNKELTARINKDYTNSSKPSSAEPNHKIIKNSREKTGRKPGGQPGHLHHPRKVHTSTIRIPIETPEEYLEDAKYKPTGRQIKKQLIRLSVNVEVIEFFADEFRNQLTGQRVHGKFPDGIDLDVNYDGTVKALAYMLNNDCYVSIGKVHDFIKDLTGGEIDISTGCITNLCKQFSEKTEEERHQTFMQLLAAPVMHGDFTFGRINGKQATVLICSNPEQTLYMGKLKKGKEGIEDSPLELYIGTVVSDHESVLIKCGERHQECMQHIERYLKASIENEPELTWNVLMLNWVKETIGYWNDVNSKKVEYDIAVVEGYLEKYNKIMEVAQKEYKDNPPAKYYKDGYNLYKRLNEDRGDYQLYLIDTAVPPTNNLAERDARKFKRKSHQVMSFRSQKGVEYFCDGLTVLQSLKRISTNVYRSVAEIFNKDMAAWI